MRAAADIELKFPAETRFIHLATTRARKVCDLIFDRSAQIDVFYDIPLCISEACANAIRHGVSHDEGCGIYLILFKMDKIDYGRGSGENVLRLLFNLAEVDFIDSSGLGVLDSRVKTIGETGRFAVCVVRDGVRSILELTRLGTVIDPFNSESEALKSKQSQS